MAAATTTIRLVPNIVVLPYRNPFVARSVRQACHDRRMIRLGLHGLGIAAGAQRTVIDAVAATAERCGFATLWVGEHVVMVDESDSHYPYSDDGRIAISADVDWLDPLITLSFAAAATNRIELATGVLLLSLAIAARAYGVWLRAGRRR